MAATDPAFRSVPRRAPCFLVWRVEQLVLQPVPRDRYGRFYRGDSYIVLSCAERGANPCIRHRESSGGSATSSGPLETHIHFWLGSQTTVDEAGVAAYKTVELDDLLGGSPVQHREVEGSESERFRAYFRTTGLRHLDGGMTAGLTPLSAKQFEPALYLVKGRRDPIIRQMPAVDWKYINDGDVFVIDSQNVFFIWTGRAANGMEKIQAAKLAQSLKEEHGGGDIVIVESGTEKDLSTNERRAFDRLLAISEKQVAPPTAAGTDEAQERRLAELIKLYRCSDQDGTLKVTEVKSGPLLQADLDPNDSFIVDNGAQGIWVWVGRRATHKERAEAMRNAQGFIRKKSYPAHTQITRVIDGGEPSEFKSLFKNWRDKHATVGLGKTSVLGKIAQQTVQSSFDATTLHENRSLSAQTQMLDGGGGQKKIWRVLNFDLVEVGEKDHGKFFSGDSYVILYTYSAVGRSRQVIYYWLGGASSLDERGTAALKAVELDDSLGGRPVQVRVVQGKEPPHFMAMFGGKMIVYTGGSSSSFDRSRGEVRASDGSRGGGCLLQVRGATSYSTRAVQVPCRAASLHSGDCFVLHQDRHTFVWYGRGATGDEREMAKRLASDLQQEPATVYEGQEPAAFWSALGGREDYDGGVERPPLEEPLQHPARLFHCSNASGRFLVHEVIDFDQSDLSTHDVALLDAWSVIYIWVGVNANQQERELSEKTALEYLRTDPAGRGTDIPIARVQQGSEPPSFTGFFGPWNTDMWKHELDWESVRESVSAANTGVARISAERASSPGAPVPTFDLAVLNIRDSAELPEGVDPANKERHLSPEQFQQVFNMTHEAFASLPAWKRTQLKKKVGLF